MSCKPLWTFTLPRQNPPEPPHCYSQTPQSYNHPSNVPTEEDAFAINYFSSMSQNSKTTQFYATVVSTLRINQLKHTQGTFDYLRKYGIYLKYN
jgi:hypothetical protein